MKKSLYVENLKLSCYIEVFVNRQSDCYRNPVSVMMLLQLTDWKQKRKY